jgi:hypothetical protein
MEKWMPLNAPEIEKQLQTTSEVRASTWNPSRRASVKVELHLLLRNFDPDPEVMCDITN